MTVYLDLIFLLDFFGDFLCLWIASALFVKAPVWRRLLGAVVGGIYGLFAAVYPFLSSIFIKFLAAIIISAIAYPPRKIHDFLKCTAVYIISSMLLSGGVMLAGDNKNTVRLILALLGSACILVSGISVFKTKIYAKYLPCHITFDGKKVRTSGFYDSGNRLVVPEGLKKVIIADVRIIKKLISPLATAENFEEFIPHEKLITINYTAPSSAVMKAFVPDEVFVNGILYDDVLVAVSPAPLEEELVLHSVMM